MSTALIVRAPGAAWRSLLPLVVLLGCSSNPRPVARADAATDSVAVGYGSVTRANSTGAVGTVTEDDIASLRVGRVEEMLQGRPGIQIYRTAKGDYTIRVRGASSLTAGGDAEPLVVVDGTPAYSASIALGGIAPADVERIDVLKDAGAAAIYGSRGANGVILVTTKRRRADPAP